MDRDYILNHVDEFSALQLFDAINQGILSLQDLRDTRNLEASKRNEIISLQNDRNQRDDTVWNFANNSEQGCRDYLNDYPAGRHIEEAKQIIERFEREREEDELKRNQIIKDIKLNPNSFTPGQLQVLLKNNIITENDLLNANIPQAIINRLGNIVTSEPRLGVTPESIPDGYTEVYFWGIPGSGKTCALAAILGTAYRKGYLELAQGPGFDYMLQMTNIFSHDISILPGRSPVDTTQYLPFALKKPDERFYRSISLIELSGEIFECFLHKNANRPLPSSEHENTFNSLIRFLNGDNRKIHFFFIDYNVRNEPDGRGYRQSQYLESAAIFFNNVDNNLFKKTDAIYIVLTKTDLMSCEKSERVNQLKEHLESNNFRVFVNSLRSRCIENSINGNRVLGTPFALGNVYFSQMCEFDSETADNIIDILMRRIVPQRQSILDVFNM